MPYFQHQFEPAGISSLGPSVELTAREVEDAGVLEVLQSPGAALGSWAFLGGLLDSTTTDFKFLEPLGMSREVKTALSGLFGRFVARAYAMRHLNFTHFAHVNADTLHLSFGGAVVQKTITGDRPDWAVWDGSKLGIIEAKGTHDWPGPRKCLDRAYRQAERVEIRVGGSVARFKRYAIATRWGFAANGPSQPMLWVKDPEIEGDGVPQQALERLGIGIALRHSAALLKPLGYAELSNALLKQAEASTPDEHFEAQQVSREVLRRTSSRSLGFDGLEPEDELIGGFVTRAGPVTGGDLTQGDRDILVRLRMRPAFVGVERRALKGVIEGSVAGLRTIQASATVSRLPGGAPFPRMVGDGTWVYRPDEDEAQLQG